eukprot:3581259-Prymnesium_polylepis.1
MIDAACAGGEALLAMRQRQRQFESRQVDKSVCTATLFGQAPVRIDVSSTLAFLPRDGLAVV